MEVEPLRDKSDIAAMHRILTKWGKVREAECFVIGCNFALRGSDLLRLKFSDVDGDFIAITENKTKKHRRFPINSGARASIEHLKGWYTEQGIEPVYLFQATGNRAKQLIKPISMTWLHKQIVDAAEAIGIDANLGTHSMRKTWGYHSYNDGVDIHHIQSAYNHSTSKVTLNYIGVTRRTVEDIYHSTLFNVH